MRSRFALLLWVSSAAFGQSSASYQVPRSSVDGGAQAASSSSYQLNGTPGQPDAQSSTSASYRLVGGFHLAATTAAQSDPIFENGFE